MTQSFAPVDLSHLLAYHQHAAPGDCDRMNRSTSASFSVLFYCSAQYLRARRPTCTADIRSIAFTSVVFDGRHHQSWMWVGSGRVGSQNSPSWVGRVASGPVSKISNEMQLICKQFVKYNS